MYKITCIKTETNPAGGSANCEYGFEYSMEDRPRDIPFEVFRRLLNDLNMEGLTIIPSRIGRRDSFLPIMQLGRQIGWIIIIEEQPDYV